MKKTILITLLSGAAVLSVYGLALAVSPQLQNVLENTILKDSQPVIHKNGTPDTPNPTPQQIAQDIAKMTPPASTLSVPNPPYASNESHPADINSVASSTISQALTTAGFPSTFEPFQVDSVWQINSQLTVVSGFSLTAGTPGIITIPSVGTPNFWPFAPIGAPGDAYIKGVKGSEVLVRQGVGYAVFNYNTHKILLSDQNADPLPASQRNQP